MKLRFLGTGTSTGVPVVMCGCPVCHSSDPRDNRRRSAVIVEYGPSSLLIDCGPDIRSQLLDAGSPPIDAVLLTHTHYDHVGGIDDLRPYCFYRPSDTSDLPVYARADVIADLRARVPYCFARHPYPGVPRLELHEIADGSRFTVEGIEVDAIPVKHGRLDILGFRIGSLAYITDCSSLSKQSVEMVRGVDTLVVNALRHSPHHSHMNLAQALDVINKTAPRRAYLTHLSHQIGLHAKLCVPEGVEVAYDGLTVEIPDK